MIHHCPPETNTILHPATDSTGQVAKFSFIGGTFVGITAWGKKKTINFIYLISDLQVQ